MLDMSSSKNSKATSNFQKMKPWSPYNDDPLDYGEISSKNRYGSMIGHNTPSAATLLKIVE